MMQTATKVGTCTAREDPDVPKEEMCDIRREHGIKSSSHSAP